MGGVSKPSKISRWFYSAIEPPVDDLGLNQHLAE